MFLQPKSTMQTLQDFLGVPVDFGRYNKICKNKVNNLAEAGEIFQDDRKYLEKIYTHEIQYLEDIFGSEGCIK